MARPQISLASLRLASREPVVNALAGFAGRSVDTWLQNIPQARAGQFLGGGGRALRDYRRFRNRFSDRQISEVLAATSPSHCMDGWTFLSQALAALLSGDTHTARHLAYYAQLRAALSILGCNGIGIFNTLNFAIDTSPSVHRLESVRPRERGLGTHTAVWEVLQLWASDRQSAISFLESVSFRGVSLSDCLDALFPSSPPTPLVARVIETWGVDLRHSAAEHESRNISSYAAHAFNRAPSNLRVRLELVRDIWLSLAPDGGGGFPSLDRHLLRRFLELMRTQHPTSKPKGGFWNARFRDLDPTIRQFASQPFLMGVDEPGDPLVLSSASGPPGDVHAMICRGVLFLRIATSIVHAAFVDAGFFPLEANVPPLFEQVGEARGFWARGQMPNDFMDLWTDVELAVTDLDDSISFGPADQHGFLDSFAGHAGFLSQTERACMWALCA